MRLSFDQARLIRQNQIFAANGIGPSGESHKPICLVNILSRLRVLELRRTSLGCQGRQSSVVSQPFLCSVSFFLDGRSHSFCFSIGLQSTATHSLPRTCTVIMHSNQHCIVHAFSQCAIHSGQILLHLPQRFIATSTPLLRNLFLFSSDCVELTPLNC